MYEQQDLNKNTSLAVSNIHTTLVTSPVLATGYYQVNLAIDIQDIPPGAVVLCGFSTTTSGDVLEGSYGQLQDEGTASTSGNCVTTGTAQINNANDQITAWATVYSGPGGATATGWSMNETPVGSVVVTH